MKEKRRKDNIDKLVYLHKLQKYLRAPEAKDIKLHLKNYWGTNGYGSHLRDGGNKTLTFKIGAASFDRVTKYVSKKNVQVLQRFVVSHNQKPSDQILKHICGIVGMDIEKLLRIDQNYGLLTPEGVCYVEQLLKDLQHIQTKMGKVKQLILKWGTYISYQTQDLDILGMTEIIKFREGYFKNLDKVMDKLRKILEANKIGG